MFFCFLFAWIVLLFSGPSRAYFAFSGDLDFFLRPFQDIDPPWLGRNSLFDVDDFDGPIYDSDDRGGEAVLHKEKLAESNGLSPIYSPPHEPSPVPINRSAACKSAQCSAEVIQSGDRDDRTTTDLADDVANTGSSASSDEMDFEPIQDDDDDDDDGFESFSIELSDFEPNHFTTGSSFFYSTTFSDPLDFTSVSEPTWSFEQADQALEPPSKLALANHNDHEDYQKQERRDAFQTDKSAEIDSDFTRRSSIECENTDPLKGAILGENGHCRDIWSKGIVSPQECKAIGGHSYLCIKNGRRICTNLHEANGMGMSQGECFSSSPPHIPLLRPRSSPPQKIVGFDPIPSNGQDSPRSSPLKKTSVRFDLPLEGDLFKDANIRPIRTKRARDSTYISPNLRRLFARPRPQSLAPLRPPPLAIPRLPPVFCRNFLPLSHGVGTWKGGAVHSCLPQNSIGRMYAIDCRLWNARTYYCELGQKICWDVKTAALLNIRGGECFR